MDVQRRWPTKVTKHLFESAPSTMALLTMMVTPVLRSSSGRSTRSITSRSTCSVSWLFKTPEAWMPAMRGALAGMASRSSSTLLLSSRTASTRATSGPVMIVLLPPATSGPGWSKRIWTPSSWLMSLMFWPPVPMTRPTALAGISNEMASSRSRVILSALWRCFSSTTSKTARIALSWRAASPPEICTTRSPHFAPPLPSGACTRTWIHAPVLFCSWARVLPCFPMIQPAASMSTSSVTGVGARHGQCCESSLGGARWA
mmetsp:Transcript_14372/g.40951  ORF Transcript_14372/g.40951 Transcript_14372/m.40951 type:complete len:259 (+) Transcript_14372:193-969(+)